MLAAGDKADDGRRTMVSFTTLLWHIRIGGSQDEFCEGVFMSAAMTLLYRRLWFLL